MVLSIRLAVTACRCHEGMRSAWGLPRLFPPPPITMSSAQIDPGDGYPQRSRSGVPRPWRGEIPSSARCSDGATQVAPISRGGGCAHAVSIADMMPSPCPMLAWHVAGCGARRRHSYGRSGRASVDDPWRLRDGWGSPALFPAGSAAMPFAEGEGLWGTVWRGGGGMGWGVGGRVGGGGDSRAKATAMVDDDDDVSTRFFFFPAVVTKSSLPAPQSLHRRCGCSWMVWVAGWLSNVL